MNEAWRNIWTIAKRELGGYFNSPVAYVFIVIYLLLNGFFTFMLGGFFERGEANLNSFFLWHPWLYLFLVPAAGMRLWSEERRVGTLELLLTMPITAWQAIVGKFMACWAFLALALFLTFPVVATVMSNLGLERWLGGRLPGMGTGDAVVLGMVLSVSAVIGDLIESLFKREAGVKDSGAIFPGIGGILDLLDSLLFNAPLMYLYLRHVLTHGDEIGRAHV